MKNAMYTLEVLACELLDYRDGDAEWTPPLNSAALRPVSIYTFGSRLIAITWRESWTTVTQL
jgi:hypothetical protein